MLIAFKKLLLFLSPFFLLSLFIFLIDPYNLFNISHIISDETKIKCLNRSHSVSPRGNILWKTIEFKRKKSPNIILGDSKAAKLNLIGIYNEPVYNLAVPGADYPTLFDLFRMADSITQLKNVIFQVSFLSYNDSFDNPGIFRPAKTLLRKPLKYFFNWTYLKDSFVLFIYSLTKNEHLVDPDYHLPGTTWNRSKDWILSELSSTKYTYPKKIYSNLRLITNYCHKNNINLIFLITPTFYEMNDLIKEKNAEDRYKHFKNDIHSMGKTIDLDNGNPLSLDKKYFYDYLHVKPEYMDSLSAMIIRHLKKEKDSSLIK